MNKIYAGLLLMVLLTSGCINDDGDNPEEFENADVQVLVGEMYFNQVTLDQEDVIEGSVGDEIVFYNEGSVRHTVTVPELGVDQIIEPGETVTVEASETLEEALVDCTLHGNHEATLTVE